MSREPHSRSPAGTVSRHTPRHPVVRSATGRSAAARHLPKRQEREQHYQRLALLGAVAIVVVVAILLGAGWYQSYVSPFRQTVITVGNRRISMAYFVTRMKGYVPEFANNDPQVVVQVLPEATTQQIENDFIVLERAPQAGVAATDQEIDSQIGQELGVPLANGLPSSRAALEGALTAKLGKTGLTLAQYREEIKAQVLTTKLQAKLGADYPRTAPEAKYELMIMNDQAGAKKLFDRLASRESWESLVAEVHNAPTTGTVAQFDFQPKLRVDPKLGDPLFALSPGNHTDVVATADGKYTIARLLEKDDQHPVSDEQIKAISPRLFADWLDEQRKTLTIKEKLSDDQKLFAIKYSGYTPQAPSQQQPVAPPSTQQQPQFNPSDVPAGVSTPTGGFGPNPAPAASGTQGP